ncbi:MAG TPA: TlpA disulfide reductase family protein [Solirubrobacteraceae bacterium]|nr:TlpA disulfide reductase family protein [Solirubrobacteraceae bacterium]
MRRALQFLAFAALVAVLVIGLTQAGSADGEDAASGPTLAELRRAVEGAPPPLAALYAEANRVVPSDPADFRRRLRSLRGYPVVVNVWGSWCGPCKLEFPYFQRAAQQLGRRVAFLGVNVIDNRANAERFLAERPVPYPSLEDGNARISQETAPGARGAPITVFYDARGRRSSVHQGGYKSEQDLIADIRRYALA